MNKIANMIGQRGIKTDSKGHPICYDAVRECLIKVEPIVENILVNNNINVLVYDYFIIVNSNRCKYEFCSIC
jgi:hypothetical protein